MKMIAFWVFFAGMLLANNVFANPPATVFIEELTWTELRDAVQSGKTTIIIPIGGTEQNGPDMALGKHNVRVKILAGKIASQLGNALVAPVISYVPEGNIDPPTEHMRFPGTITIPVTTFETVLEYAARSFKLHGFKNIIFLGDHGGYQADEKQVADRLNQEWQATPVRVHAIPEYYQSTQTLYVQALEKQGYQKSEIGMHAGLADTSLMLAIDPSLVRADRLKNGPTLTTADGVYGDPRLASPALGQLGEDIIIAQTVAAIKMDTLSK